MQIVQSLSIFTIAAILVVEFAMDRVWPSVYLAFFEEQYKRVHIDCAKASSSLEQARYTGTLNVGDNLRTRLLLSAQTELVACHDHDQLRTKLLSNGVSPLNLKLLELEAMASNEIPLDIMIAPYR